MDTDAYVTTFGGDYALTLEVGGSCLCKFIYMYRHDDLAGPDLRCWLTPIIK